MKLIFFLCFISFAFLVREEICETSDLREYPVFKQGDDKWGDDEMGEGGATIAEVGCLMSALSMALNGLGESIPGYGESNPGTLNSWLRENSGYTYGSGLYWGAIESFSELVFVTNDLDLNSVASYICDGDIIMLHVNGGTHWVLATGVGDGIYYVNDAGSGTDGYYLQSGVSAAARYDASAFPLNPSNKTENKTVSQCVKATDSVNIRDSSCGDTILFTCEEGDLFVLTGETDCCCWDHTWYEFKYPNEQYESGWAASDFFELAQGCECYPECESGETCNNGVCEYDDTGDSEDTGLSYRIIAFFPLVFFAILVTI